MVDKAFLKFDKDGSGEIEACDLKGVYNCNFHPKVQSGEMTEDEVFLEFLANFGDKNRDGKIQKDEWNEYYAAVSSSIDNDEHFVQLMRAAWKLAGSPPSSRTIHEKLLYFADQPCVSVTFSVDLSPVLSARGWGRGQRCGRDGSRQGQSKT